MAKIINLILVCCFCVFLFGCTGESKEILLIGSGAGGGSVEGNVSFFVTNEYFNVTQNFTNNVTQNFTTVNNITNNITNNYHTSTTIENNYTYNYTTNVTVNITNNFTTINNITQNFTYNYTFNITQQINYTYNITNNITQNFTYNYTSNITNNITQQINYTYNITNNVTYNITTNLTNNITQNFTYNYTNNITQQVNYTYNITYNITNNITQQINYTVALTNNSIFLDAQYNLTNKQGLLNTHTLACQNITGATSNLCTLVDTWNTTTQMIMASFLGLGNATEQGLRINTLNATLLGINTSINIKALGFNITTELNQLYPLKSQITACSSGYYSRANTTQGFECFQDQTSAGGGASNNSITLSVSNITSQYRFLKPVYTDFLEATTSGIYGGYAQGAIGSGTVTLHSEQNHIGILNFSSSATSSSGVVVYTNLASYYRAPDSYGIIIARLYTKSGNYSVYRLGFQNTITATMPTQALYFNITNLTVTALARNASLLVNTLTNYNLTNNTWYTFTITINQSQGANFSIYNESQSLLWSTNVSYAVSANENRPLGFGLTAYVQGGTTAQRMGSVDYLELGKTSLLDR